MAAQSKNCFERYEKKYRLTAAQQRMVLEGMRPYMKKDAYGAYTICNIYYDTDDWRLIRASLEKPVYKEKLRVRSYGVPDGDGKVFVELKKKYDGVVYKRRVTMGAGEAAPFLAGDIPNAHGQIGQEILWFQRFYQARPRVFIAYDRLAFAGIDDPELRITFDTNLRWRNTALDLRLGDDGGAHHRTRHDPDGDQDPRRVSPVAQPASVSGGGVPHVVFQVRLLLSASYLTEHQQGGTLLCLVRS